VIRIGDVLTVAMPSAVRILRVAAFTERRGGAPEARKLYEDLSPPSPRQAPAPPPARRDPSSGRPTKRERRALLRLRQRSAGLDN